MRYYCNICRETISLADYKSSTKEFQKALCKKHQPNNKENTQKSVKSSPQAKYDKQKSPKSTPQAIKLSNALTARKIKNEREAYDGYKHVDISIPWAKIHIEVDGTQHILNVKQSFADIERTRYSGEDGFVTVRYRNYEIDRYLEKIADNIAQNARKRYRQLQEGDDKPGWFGDDIMSFFSDLFK